MNTQASKPPSGPGTDIHSPPPVNAVVGVVVELSAIITLCVILIALVDGFGG